MTTQEEVERQIGRMSRVKENTTGFMQFKDLEINELFIIAPYTLSNDVWVKVSPTNARGTYVLNETNPRKNTEVVRRVRFIETVEPY